MIYYPISTLMLAGIREILIITTPHDQSQFKELLGDGSDLGVSFQYAQQPEPKGLAQAFTIGEDFLAGDSCLMILGDNIFQGTGLGRDLIRLIPKSGAHIFTYEVRNPSDYGVLIKDSKGLPMLVVEKPERFVSNLAVTGLYFFDSNVVNYARSIKPSNRGELEITSIIQMYIDDKKLTFTELSRGSAWLDTGSAKNLNDASNFVRVIEERTGLKIGCLEEIALAQGWIKSEKLSQTHSMNNEYSKYVRNLVKEKNNG
jgi:glucose-1-phosphate thymidylyltransferase